MQDFHVSTDSLHNRPAGITFLSGSDASISEASALMKKLLLERSRAYVSSVAISRYGRTNVSPAILLSFEWVEETGASIVRAPDFEIRQLETIYEFNDYYEVTNYLKEHSYLLELLFEAFSEIERLFGRNPRVLLKVVNDPDIEDENQLFAYIHTTLSPKEALSRMEILDEEWFLNQIDRARGKFNLNIEFV